MGVYLGIGKGDIPAFYQISACCFRAKKDQTKTKETILLEHRQKRFHFSYCRNISTTLIEIFLQIHGTALDTENLAPAVTVTG